MATNVIRKKHVWHSRTSIFPRRVEFIGKKSKKWLDFWPLFAYFWHNLQTFLGVCKNCCGLGGLSFLLNIDLKYNFHINWDAFDPFYQPKLVWISRGNVSWWFTGPKRPIPLKSEQLCQLWGRFLITHE